MRAFGSKHDAWYIFMSLRATFKLIVSARTWYRCQVDPASSVRPLWRGGLVWKNCDVDVKQQCSCGEPAKFAGLVDDQSHIIDMNSVKWNKPHGCVSTQSSVVLTTTANLHIASYPTSHTEQDGIVPMRPFLYPGSPRRPIEFGKIQTEVYRNFPTTTHLAHACNNLGCHCAEKKMTLEHTLERVLELLHIIM